MYLGESDFSALVAIKFKAQNWFNVESIPLQFY